MTAIVDLTEDFSSDVEASNENALPSATSKPTMAGETSRQPLRSLKNNARPKDTGGISPQLSNAIQTLSEQSLKKYLIRLCCLHEGARHDLESCLLVKGKDVVRYHIDSESEDDQDSEIESESSEDEDAREDKNRKPIAVADDEWTARFAKCEHCNEEFDVMLNERGDCQWHTDLKSVDFDSDTWADHDVNCHGSYESFEDEPNFAEGFIWECCDKPGDDLGCKSTKHKAKVNVVVPLRKQENIQSFPVASRKRRAGEELVRPEPKKSTR